MAQNVDHNVHPVYDRCLIRIIHDYRSKNGYLKNLKSHSQLFLVLISFLKNSRSFVFLCKHEFSIKSAEFFRRTPLRWNWVTLSGLFCSTGALACRRTATRLWVILSKMSLHDCLCCLDLNDFKLDSHKDGVFFQQLKYLYDVWLSSHCKDGFYNKMIIKHVIHISTKCCEYYDSIIFSICIQKIYFSRVRWHMSDDIFEKCLLLLGVQTSKIVTLDILQGHNKNIVKLFWQNSSFHLGEIR